MNQAPTTRHPQEAKNCFPQCSTKMTHYQDVSTDAGQLFGQGFISELDRQAGRFRKKSRYESSSVILHWRFRVRSGILHFLHFSWVSPPCSGQQTKGAIARSDPNSLDERGGQRMALGVALGPLAKKLVKLLHRGRWDLGRLQIVFDMLNRLHADQ